MISVKAMTLFRVPIMKVSLRRRRKKRSLCNQSTHHLRKRTCSVRGIEKFYFGWLQISRSNGPINSTFVWRSKWGNTFLVTVAKALGLIKINILFYFPQVNYFTEVKKITKATFCFHLVLGECSFWTLPHSPSFPAFAVYIRWSGLIKFPDGLLVKLPP